VFIPISVATERQRPLHQLRGHGERVRAVLREASGVADAATVFAAIAVAEGVPA
jgi:hypothetical protein